MVYFPMDKPKSTSSTQTREVIYLWTIKILFEHIRYWGIWEVVSTVPFKLLAHAQLNYEFI